MPRRSERNGLAPDAASTTWSAHARNRHRRRHHRDGKMLRGFLGMAGELGHITVVPNGNPCGCGNRGCVEKYASATAVTAMAKLLGLGDEFSRSRFTIWRIAGNEKASTIFISMGEALGIALAS